MNSLIFLSFQLSLVFNIVFRLTPTGCSTMIRISLILFYLTWFIHSDFVSGILHFLLLLSLKIILRKVAVLTQAVWVVRLVDVLTSCSHLCLTSSVIAIVAHVFGIVFFVDVRALVYISSSLIIEKWVISVSHLWHWWEILKWICKDLLILCLSFGHLKLIL